MRLGHQAKVIDMYLCNATLKYRPNYRTPLASKQSSTKMPAPFYAYRSGCIVADLGLEWSTS